MDFENTFLYFFSTIPQVLGALIALLGVFVLFKFQSIKNSIVSFGRQTQDYLEEEFILKASDKQIDLMKRNLQHGIVRNDQETVASQVAGINSRLKEIIDLNHLTENQKYILWRINHTNEIQFDCLKSNSTISKKTKFVLINSGIVIFISLILLMFVPLLTSESICLFYPFIAGGIVLVWFGYCILKTIQIMITSIKRDY